LISANLIDHGAFSGLCLNEKGTVAVMLNEEDHVRIQAILPGVSLAGAYNLAEMTDDRMSDKADFAYHPRLGYLTSCPTNAGTAMRASVMVFLPALTFTGNIGNVVRSVEQEGIVLRGFYGESTDPEGCFYQISNKYSLGVSEEEIINKVDRVVKNLADTELSVLAEYYEKRRDVITDKVMRAYGTLRFCRLLSTKELLNELIYLRIGALLSILKLRDPGDLNNLMVRCRPANLIVESGEAELSDFERDARRAALTRDVIGNCITI
ncbi:MAG: ATP--guanido phosphotransferase, partial [Firmicutes bacterium]|nr:ATP--guanido phosphotransferase [Bacillota bacterium]